MPYTASEVIIAVKTVQDRGRVQLPKELRDSLQLKDGDGILWLRMADGRFTIAKNQK